MDLILYNPLSKNSKGNIQTHKLIRQYKKHNIPFRLKSILKIADMKVYLEDKEHIEKIILLGGDGTINNFVNNIADIDLKQSIFLKSNGTGNDFLRTLRLDDTAPQHILQVTYDTGVKSFFMNGAGMGVDGQIGVSISSSKKKGKYQYLFHTLKTILKFIPEPLTVVADGKTYNFDKTYLITVNNGKYFGGGMKVTPKANLSDELMDVVVVHTIPKIFILPLFFTIYVGLHVKFKKYVTVFKAKNVKASFTTPQVSQADGENFFDVTSMEVKSSLKTIHLQYFDNKKSA